MYSRRIIVNLSPANIRKEGSILDLPMAIGVLLSMEEIHLDRIDSNKNNKYNQPQINIAKKTKKMLKKELEEKIQETAFVGELSLDGKLNRINGILPIAIEARKLGIKKIIMPKENLKEASVVNDIEALGAEDLNEVISYLKGKIELPSLKTNWNELEINKLNQYNIDFSDVKGQKNVKRALEIASAGGHNCILIGSPGSGKTMLSQRIPTILPDISFEEALETTKIHSISGNIKDNILIARPFRSPHHTITIPSLIGGGSSAKPGEISLAHNGVLFLDELAEFNRATLEVLRGPLEDKKITINRSTQSLTYPCNFMLVASMNPCLCGYYGSNIKKCICSKKDIKRYISKISGPLLDRIDLQIEVQAITYTEVEEKEKETSQQIRARVNKARQIQIERYKEENIFSNSQLNSRQIEKYCKIDEESKQILEQAFNKLNLSVRAYSRILKVARTIADLEGKQNIEKKHIAEAIKYRSLDKKYINKEEKS